MHILELWLGCNQAYGYSEAPSRCASDDDNGARGEKLEAKDKTKLEKIGEAAREGCKAKPLPAARS